jgi:integrase
LILPPTLTKNGREHVLPLGALASQLLKTSSNGLVFPGRIEAPFNGWSKAKSQLDELSAVSDWTLHDIRRTVATRMAEMGVAPHVIERILNHASGQISGVALVYNRARYIEEMRAALELWERRLAAALK